MTRTATRPISDRNRDRAPQPHPGFRALPPGLAVTRQLDSVLNKIRAVVANGHFTERGLASFIGMSQPHVHHLLAGDRTLTAPVADHILARLGISLAELLDEAEIQRAFDALRRDREPTVGIPLLSGKLGPCGPIPAPTGTTVSVECRLLAGASDPVLAALGPDPEMASLLSAATHAVIRENGPSHWDPAALYAVEHAGALVVRGLRPGLRCTYLLTAESWNRPNAWQRADRLRRAPARLMLAVFDGRAYRAFASPAPAAAS